MSISNLRFFTQEFSLQEPSIKDKPNLCFPSKILSYWRDYIDPDPTIEKRKEHLFVIPINTKLEALGHTVISSGTVNESLCHPVEVLRPVLMAGMYHFIMIHNHPSGSTEPSLADERMTKIIQESADIMKIQFVDHVIIGTNPDKPLSYYSFKEEGKL